MAIPVKYCTLVKAQTDPGSFHLIRERMLHNIELEELPTIPCKCTPPCPKLGDSELQALLKRFVENNPPVLPPRPEPEPTPEDE